MILEKRNRGRRSEVLNYDFQMNRAANTRAWILERNTFLPPCRVSHASKNEEKKWDGERFRIFDRAKEESSIRCAIDICICESYESYFERKRERRFPSDIFDYSSSRFAPSFLDTHNHNFPISSRKICNTPGRYPTVYHRVSHQNGKSLIEIGGERSIKLFNLIVYTFHTRMH